MLVFRPTTLQQSLTKRLDFDDGLLVFVGLLDRDLGVEDFLVEHVCCEVPTNKLIVLKYQIIFAQTCDGISLAQEFR